MENANFGHECFSQLLREHENMQARAKALLNKIHENRVFVKKLHAELGIAFGKMIHSKNQVEDECQQWQNLTRDLISKREKIIAMCDRTRSNT